ncbi:Exosome complex exonuclease RRP46 homolog [Coccomyxa sp. Obi]|nr:Exosome complex exonuclease RRP46 homolog [Coccomyxa sp. Obi]
MDHDRAGPSGNGQARNDDRTPLHIRTLTCERGPLSRADGSARWAQGGTSVLASVYGPQSTAARKEDPEKMVVEVLFKQQTRSVGSDLERQYEHTIRGTVEGVIQAAQNPRTAVSITLQVMSDDGALLACALNAACAALVDAAVPMTSTFVAASVALDQECGLLLDPTKEEEAAARATGCFAFPASVKEPGGKIVTLADGLLTCVSTGLMKTQDYLSMLDLAKKGCERVAAFAKLSLDKAFQSRD